MSNQETARWMSLPRTDRRSSANHGAVGAGSSLKLRRPVSVEQIVAHCNEHLADYKVPRYVVELDKPLPRLASGKIAKRILKELLPDIPATFPRVR